MSIDWRGFPEAVALALAGLTALLAAVSSHADVRVCTGAAIRSAEHWAVPVAAMSGDKAILKDMLLHN